jgi:hypothetical protein
LFEIDNRLKLMTGLFLLLALLILGYNALKIIVLFDTPLIGVSLESRLAKEKWNRLETLVSEKKNKDWSKSFEFLTRKVPLVELEVEEEIAPVQEAIPVEEYDREIMPEIAGIIETSGSNGKLGASVIIGDKSYYEKEKIGEYMIEKISENGIYLIKDEESLFIEAPIVPFSVDRGD